MDTLAKVSRSSLDKLSLDFSTRNWISDAFFTDGREKSNRKNNVRVISLDEIPRVFPLLPFILVNGYLQRQPFSSRDLTGKQESRFKRYMLIRDLVCAAVAPHYEDFQFYPAATWINIYTGNERAPLQPLSLAADSFANVISAPWHGPR